LCDKEGGGGAKKLRITRIGANSSMAHVDNQVIGENTYFQGTLEKKQSLWYMECFAVFNTRRLAVYYLLGH